MKTSCQAVAVTASFVAAGLAPAASANQFIDLGGPATGFVAVNNFKNSSSQNGIEGLDSNGNFNPGHNGLPDYPNFQIPVGGTNAGVFSAVIASPQSTANDYATALSNAFYGGASVVVNNQTITEPAAATLSAGRIDFDNALVTGTGIETVPVTALNFDFNTFAWDGTVDPAVTGDPRSNFSTAPLNVSPFSSVFTPFNDGSGSGNAQLYYL
ncbi:MAG: hypothetical protein AAF916_13085, partial [Planctomycetota bacterium]